MTNGSPQGPTGDTDPQASRGDGHPRGSPTRRPDPGASQAGPPGGYPSGPPGAPGQGQDPAYGGAPGSYQAQQGQYPQQGYGQGPSGQQGQYDQGGYGQQQGQYGQGGYDQSGQYGQQGFSQQSGQGYGQPPGSGPSDADGGHPGGPEKRNWLPIIVILTLVVALAVAAVVWFLVARDDGASPQPSGSVTLPVQTTPMETLPAESPPAETPAVEATPAEPIPENATPVEPTVDEPPAGAAPNMPLQVGEFATEEPNSNYNMYMTEDFRVVIVMHEPAVSTETLTGEVTDPQTIGSWTCGTGFELEGLGCVTDAHGGYVLVSGATDGYGGYDAVKGVTDANELAAWGDQFLALWK